MCMRCCFYVKLLFHSSHQSSGTVLHGVWRRMHHTVSPLPLLLYESRRSQMYLSLFFHPMKRAMIIAQLLYVLQPRHHVVNKISLYHEPLMLQPYPMTQFTCIYYHRTKAAIGWIHAGVE